MKTLIILTLIAMFNLSAFGEEVRCQAVTDLGTISGYGSNKHEARAVASEKCFDQRLAMYEARRGGVPDGEQADMIMDYCVNLKCK